MKIDGNAPGLVICDLYIFSTTLNNGFGLCN